MTHIALRLVLLFAASLSAPANERPKPTSATPAIEQRIYSADKKTNFTVVDSISEPWPPTETHEEATTTVEIYDSNSGEKLKSVALPAMRNESYLSVQELTKDRKTLLIHLWTPVGDRGFIQYNIASRKFSDVVAFGSEKSIRSNKVDSPSEEDVFYFSAEDQVGLVETYSMHGGALDTRLYYLDWKQKKRFLVAVVKVKHFFDVGDRSGPREYFRPSKLVEGKILDVQTIDLPGDQNLGKVPIKEIVEGRKPIIRDLKLEH